MDSERMLCPDCKTELPDNASLCRECGELFDKSSLKSKHGSMKVLLLCSFLVVAGFFAFPFLKEFSHEARDRKVKEGMQIIAAGLEAYYENQGAYPPWEMNAEAPSDIVFPHILTTPVSCLSFLSDKQGERWINYLDYPWSLRRSRYYSTDRSYFIWNPGPDRDYDLGYAYLQDVAKFGKFEGVIELHNYCYDVTNGILSGGDVFRAGGLGTELVEPRKWK